MNSLVPYWCGGCQKWLCALLGQTPRTCKRWESAYYPTKTTQKAPTQISSPKSFSWKLELFHFSFLNFSTQKCAQSLHLFAFCDSGPSVYVQFDAPVQTEPPTEPPTKPPTEPPTKRRRYETEYEKTSRSNREVLAYARRNGTFSVNRGPIPTTP